MCTKGNSVRFLSIIQASKNIYASGSLRSFLVPSFSSRCFSTPRTIQTNILNVPLDYCIAVSIWLRNVVCVNTLVVLHQVRHSSPTKLTRATLALRNVRLSWFILPLVHNKQIMALLRSWDLRSGASRLHCGPIFGRYILIHRIV